MLRHLPNLICVFRILLVWPIVRALYAADYGLALMLFGVAAVSDGLDGYLAKRFNWTSDLGKILDPVADKLLLVVVFVVATWLGLVPWWLTAAAVARDVLIALGAMIYSLWFGDLRGRPTVISKINTGVQIVYLIGVIVSEAIGVPAPEVLGALAFIVLATTLISGLHYLTAFTRRAWADPAVQER